jgi:RNA polymerase sigma-70 factor (ECF subfamily)
MEENKPDFQQVYEAYQPKILRYLARLVGEPGAEDLTQEVFVKVARGLRSFRGESQLSTWLYRIATNTAIDKIRNASFRQETELSGLDESDEVEDKDLWMGEEVLSIEQQLMRKQMYECFLDYVKRLPPGYRSVIVLSELEELSNNEIAKILGLSLDVVKIRLHRGRARLFQELKAHCRAEDWL